MQDGGTVVLRCPRGGCKHVQRRQSVGYRCTGVVSLAGSFARQLRMSFTMIMFKTKAETRKIFILRPKTLFAEAVRR